MEDEWDDALLSEIAALESRHLQSSNNSNSNSNSNATPAAALWSCKSCTLQNAGERTSCLVCGTLRGQLFPPSAAATASTGAKNKRTVQSTISFGGTVAPVATVVAPSLRPQEQRSAMPRNPTQAVRISQQTVLTAAPVGSGLVSTTNRTAVEARGGTPGPLTMTLSPVQIPRRAAGEDAQAKTRYLDVMNRSSFPEIDFEAAQQFVYPTNYSVRDYQLAIAEKALYHNTLVSLPTGLGKTLVAAVVMYNFYRWFPTGKIVFMAPTKPLVAQQIRACHEIMGIPLADTAELQGNVPPATRRVLWRSKRVFFCTPQSLQNDLRRGVCAAEKFVCVVVDEAHRATGNYAYCCVVQEIEAKTQFFRVLALSATPGAKFDVIQDVVNNLRISHIESRSADDADVKKYTHARQEEVIVCHLGVQITQVKLLFLKCFQRIVQRLFTGNIIQHRDPEKLSSWYVLQARERFRKSPNYSSNRSAESDLALLVSLLHARNLLTGHGLSSFREQIVNWVEERQAGRMSWSKREMLQSSEFHALELSLAVTAGANDTAPISTNAASHPKLTKLREVLHEHFRRHAAGNSSTRAIVFTQYRASVVEIVALLRTLAPLINAQPFVGQGASGKAKENKGQSQKLQQEIVRKFRQGEFNVLVATCIAEEGLDIGEVDLIVSFDALTSPVRMIQRMGRTGRKRVGKVIILVTEGDEEKKLARSASAAKTVSRALTTFKNKFTYSKCPRMLPSGIRPQLSELAMNIPVFHASQVAGKQSSSFASGGGRGQGGAAGWWELNDIEKAVAVTKYFPPNFAASHRNMLFPVMASRQHLLRRHPRVGGRTRRRLAGSRQVMGHSLRSLVLQGLVRKINGVEDVPDSSSDEEDDGKIIGARRREATAAPERNSEAQPHTFASKEQKPHRETTCSAVGSARRSSGGDTAGERDDDDRDMSFTAADESVDNIDMHFSPQFNEPVPDLTPADQELGGRPSGSNKRQRGSPVPPLAPVLKKAKIAVSDQAATPLLTPLPTPVLKKAMKAVGGQASPPAKQRLPNGLPSASTKAAKAKKKNSTDGGIVDHQRISAADLERGERLLEQLQHLVSMSATLSSSLSLESPPAAPTSSSTTMPQQQPPLDEDSSAIESLSQLPAFPRLRSTRRLQFDAAEAPDTRKENCIPEPPQRKLPNPVASPPPSEPSARAGLASETEDSASLATDDVPVYSFALLPSHKMEPEDPAESEPGLPNEDDVVEVEPPVYSFALLPPLNGDPVIVPSKPRRSLALRIVESQQEDSQKARDVPAVDVAVEATQIKSVVEAVAESNPGVVDLTDEEAPRRATALGPVPAALRDETLQLSAHIEREGSDAKDADDESCSICRESESFDDDPIVFCDGCNVAVHQFCYGIRVVPSGTWFCEVCAEASAGAGAPRSSQPRCHLCPLRGGAFKRTACGQWVHVQCFLWIPELEVQQGNDDMLTLGTLSRLDPDRKTLDCSLCHSGKGHGIVQCAYKRCLIAFHVSCAAFARYRMDQLDPPEGEDTGVGTLFLVYCPMHRKSTAPVIAPRQQGTPPTASARSPLPRSAATSTTATSPSHLLVSPPSAESAKRFRCFRRLKRKYDASQSQTPVQAKSRGSPAVQSPWQKRVKRSKRHVARRKALRALAATFIENDVEVRGGGDDDDDDDDEYGDDYEDAEDNSFINDSSQLLYSQSVASPEGAGTSNTSKKRRKPSPDMRAIYARSLLESQSSPLLLRRGGRQLGALPANGVIRACLEQLQGARSDADTTPSPRPRPSSRTREETERAAASISHLPPTSAAAPVVEETPDCVDEVEDEVAPPCFNLLGACASLPSVQENVSAGAGSVKMAEASSAVTVVQQQRNIGSGDSGAVVDSVTSAQSCEVEGTAEFEQQQMRKRMEANRLRALEKLQQRRQTQLKQRSSEAATHPRLAAHRVASTAAVAAVTVETRDEVVAVPSFTLLAPPTSLSGSRSRPAREATATATATATVTAAATAFQRPESASLQQSPVQLAIAVNTAFGVSSAFPVFVAAKRAGCSVDIEASLEADVLLSLRTAVLFLTASQLHELALAAPARNLQKHPRIQTLLAIHKKLVIAIAHDGGDLPELPRLQQLPNTTIVVQPSVEALCAQLHHLAWQERAEGFHLPPPGSTASGSAMAKELDADFASRLAFFRSIPVLTLGCALSLSFRFKNFAAAQVPVRKFNDMHWRRMLPWVSEATAKGIHRYIERNVHGAEQN
ncbi:hypothetical protein BBJ28_00007668 [Nothophytophthora sp. Chile5]|nr:hypothetical protein BBJ28_00007668 [Nothophytophthora sp. Chile5]